LLGKIEIVENHYISPNLLPMKDFTATTIEELWEEILSRDT